MPLRPRGVPRRCPVVVYVVHRQERVRRDKTLHLKKRGVRLDSRWFVWRAVTPARLAIAAPADLLALSAAVCRCRRHAGGGVGAGLGECGCRRFGMAATARAKTPPAETLPLEEQIRRRGATGCPGARKCTLKKVGTFAAPVAQSIQVTGIPAGTTIGARATVFNGTCWLGAATGSTAGTVNVGANGARAAWLGGGASIRQPANSPFF
jgi:hypothetical protein